MYIKKTLLKGLANGTEAGKYLHRARQVGAVQKNSETQAQRRKQRDEEDGGRIFSQIQSALFGDRGQEAMSKLDRQKEKIAFWRTMFFFLLASIFGLVAFVFTKYDKLSEIQLILVNIAGFMLLIGIIGTTFKLKKEIDEIEEM